jgi:hypothetical protein
LWLDSAEKLTMVEVYDKRNEEGDKCSIYTIAPAVAGASALFGAATALMTAAMTLY